jgi:hypothetical protein
MPIRQTNGWMVNVFRKADTARAAPSAVLLLVVRRLAPLSVSDDRRSTAHRTPTWHQLQVDPGYPGTALSSAGGNEIKRITAGVKACRWFSLPGLSGDRPSPSWCIQYPTKKEYCLW